jgi:hypothetical protein
LAETVAHIARTVANAIVHQGMKNVIATGRGITGTATETGIVVTEIVMEAGGMTDMTVVGTSVVLAMKTVAAFGEGEALLERNHETETAVHEESRTRMG